MYTQSPHFKEQSRRRRFPSLFPTLIGWSLLALPLIISAGDNDGGFAADNAADEPGVTFRIQDYVPGTFESRLQYIHLYGANSGEWNMPFNVRGRRRVSPGPNSPSYYLPDYNTNKRFYVSTQSSGSYNRLVHRESPKLVTDKELAVSGYFAPRKRDFRDDEPDLSRDGHGLVYTGQTGYYTAEIGLRYSDNHWRYSDRGWSFMVNPSIDITLERGQDKEDTKRENVWYNVGDTLELRQRDLQGRYRRQKQSSFTTLGGLYLAAGRGRVYDGTSSWRAIELLTTVAEMTGRSTAQVSQDDMEQLAAILYELQYKKYPLRDRTRLFEYARTEQVTTHIASTLEVESLLPGTIAVIHDILKYYPTFTRPFGQRWYVLTGGELVNNTFDSHSDRHTTEYDEQEEHYSRITKTGEENVGETRASQIMVGAIYEFFRPLSHQWQLNLQGSASLYQDFEKKRYQHEETYWRHYWDSDTFETSTTWGDTVACWQPVEGATIVGDMRLLYIKNSRTWLEFSTKAKLIGNKWFPHPEVDPESLSKQTAEAWEATLEGRIEYHHSLAWKLYLTARLSYRASYGHLAHSRMSWADDKGGAGRYALSISLDYYL